MPNENSYGYLIVKVSTASDAIPIENASVIVQGKDEHSRSLHPRSSCSSARGRSRQ